MTEEIINGIDVSECCFYNNGKCDNPNGMACNCINNAICYFKELKRLEQENKELRKANEISIEKVTVTAEAKRLQELEQENKELKIYIESNKQQVEEAEMLVMDNDRLQQEVENLKDTIYYDVERYRSALEEIREILQKPDLPTVDEDNLMTATELLVVVDKNRQTKLMNIQDRINEVLNDGN